MSEIVASNVASTNETKQVIEDLQNVGSVDKSAKLSALLGKDTVGSPAAEGETTNGVSDGDKTDVQHNGSNENGDSTAEHTAKTTSEDASNPTTNEELSLPSTEETSDSATGTEESSTKSDEMEPDESTKETTASDAVSKNRCTKQLPGGCSTEKPCGAEDCTAKSESSTSTTSEIEVPSSTESNKSPVKVESSDQDAVNKKMGELNVESEGSKDVSPRKKSCSPF